MDLKKLMADLEKKNPGQVEFLQAAREVLESIEEFVNTHPKYDSYKIVERVVEPDRIFQFRVTWVDEIGRAPV